MNAVPKKKLCWNCEGNISRDIDNCPYCAVYLHVDENSNWSPSYQPSSKTEEIPSPLYQKEQDSEEDHQEQDSSQEDAENFNWSLLMRQLKQDIFPLLFLMMGSVFFLFGVVLWLFAQNGTLTLQWQGDHGLYFLIAALPLMLLGWKFFRQLETSENAD